MNTMLIIVAVLALLSAFVVACEWLRNRSRNIEVSNINEGTRPTGARTYLAAAAITTRYVFVKQGVDVSHVAICSAITDKVIGVCTDEPSAAEEECNVNILMSSLGTQRVTANAAIAVGAFIGPATTGFAQTAVATQFPCGRALTAAGASGDIIEFDPIATVVAI